MKSMKLGMKVLTGFGMSILIACTLGGLAVWNMRGVEKDAIRLAREYVPEVAVANEVERASLLTMFEVRGYALTGEESYLARGREHLRNVERHLEAALAHSEMHKGLVKLRENALEAGAKVKEYAHLLEQTVARDKAMERNRETMGQTADRFIAACAGFLKTQQEALDKEVAEGAEGARIQERVKKVVWMNDALDVGNSVRVGNWRSQATRDPKLMQSSTKGLSEVFRKLEEIKGITRSDEDLKQLSEVRASAEGYKRAMEEYLANWTALQEVGERRGKAVEGVLSAARVTASAGMDQATQIANDTVATLSRSTMVMVVGLLLAVILGVGAAILITRSITKPIHRIIEGLSESSEQVATASEQVSSASQFLAEGSSEQAASLEESSSSLEEMSSMTKQNAENAALAKARMADARRVVEKVDTHMGRMAEAIAQISRSSEETGKIIKTIDEIAFQTNLLALNAAVEAARAGDAGAGFAVVAGEVRNLAMRAADAARNTANLIEGTIKAVREGSDLTQSTQAAFEENMENAAKVGELVDEIAAACMEQAKGIDQVNKAVAEMDKVVQQSAANAEESASAAEEMNAQAGQMKEFVEELLLVAGKGRRSRGGVSGHRHQTAPAPPAPAKRPGPTRERRERGIAHTGGKELDPGKVIPLEKEFEDF